jgi:hypothetical protein
MGLLDEAIRDHLELKRRRGADPGEIARQEREALGPARRAETVPPEEQPTAVAPAAAPAAEWEEAADPAIDETGFDEVDEEDADEGWEDDDDLDELDDVEDAAEPAPALEPPEVAPRASAAAAPAPVAPPPPPAPPAPADPALPTSEFDVLGDDETAEAAAFRAPEPPEGADDEDVLEETPEFLQETPEHDRLWFEQRPPRDFDFDG